MTTVAMILGMLPSAFGGGEGSEFRAPISIATIGGLITSTLLTLVVIPVSYLLLDRFVERLRAFRLSSLPPAAQAAARVTGVLIILAILGAFVSVARAFAQEALTIERALRLAHQRNDSLKVDIEKLREAQAHVSEAKAAFLPTLDLNFLYTPAQEFPLLRIPAGVFGPTEQTFKANFTRENIMRLDVTQPLYTGGRLNQSYAIQAAGQEASRLQLERARQALTFKVYETFYAALMNDQGTRVNEEGVRIAERHLELAKVRFESGTVARLDVLRAEVELANAKAKLIRAKSAATVAYQALRAVLAMPQDAPLQLAGTLDEAPAVPALADLETAVLARADLRAIDQQKEMAERSVSLALAELKPTVAFAGNFQYQEDDVSNLLGQNNRSYQFGLAVNVPLFAAPTVAAKKNAATARVKQAEHGSKATLDNARLELASASTALDASQEIVVTQQKAVELAREGLTIAEVSYENGVITSTELNDARLSLLETEWEMMQAKYVHIVAAARTRFAAGLP
jgi:outer membrane protein TolC